MEVTHELKNEHQFILKYIELMEGYVELSQENREENFFLEKSEYFISFIEKFADAYHHAKEEDVLFKFLQIPGVLSHCNPLPVMLSEHEQGRVYLQNMKDAVANKNVNSLYENIHGYSELLKQHIFKEDHVLYPMAEKGMSDNNKIAVKLEYKKIEEKLSKQKIWKEYEEKYIELEKYLSSNMLTNA